MFTVVHRRRSGPLAVGLLLAALVVLPSVPARAFPVVGSVVPSAERHDVILEVESGSTPALVRELRALGISPTSQYDSAFAGAAVSVTDAQLSAIHDRIDTVAVVTDNDVTLFATDTQQEPPWNLDRVDQQAFTAFGGARSYSYPSSGGAGVYVYVLDTGFTRQNSELDGRVVAGADFAGGDHGTPGDVSDDSSTRDCEGHGTHVAGTIASTTYGAAKRATIVPVRVFTCSGPTSTSVILNGIEWVIENRPVGRPAVMNMSLGTTGGSALIDQATQNAIDAGITVVVSAGNGGRDAFGDDACFGSVNSQGQYENGTSPARVADAITVGATGFENDANTPEGYLQDLEAYFSNFGTCVDILAPGGNVTSLSFDGSAPSVKSGTSMAAPLVAGVAALYLGLRPSAAPSEVRQALVGNSVANAISPAHVFWPRYIAGYPSVRANPTTNALLNTQFMDSLVPLASAPLALSADASTGSTVHLLWSEPSFPVDSDPADYRVQFRESGSSTWLTFSDGVSATTSATVTGLAPNRTFEFQVAAIVDDQAGPYSATTSKTTASGVPSAPLTLGAGSRAATTVSLTWGVPTSLNGGTITDYRVQYRRLTATSWLTFTDEVSPTAAATVSGLTASKTYQFRVAAMTAQGMSVYSAVVSASTRSGVTSAPVRLVTGAATSTTVPLSWGVPTSLNGGTVIDYTVQYRRSGSTTWLTVADAVSATAAATVSGLTRNTSYQFRVAAVTAQGRSVYSAAVSTSTANQPA